MKSNLIPIIPHKQTSILGEELKEQRLINSIARREIKKKIKDVESAKDFFVYITKTNIYWIRYKKKQKKQKNIL
jgi:hypothetical protein